MNRTCALAWLSLVLAVDAQQPKKKAGAAKPQIPIDDARIAGEIGGDLASDPGKQSDWPALAAATDGALWAAYVEWNDKDADRVVVRRRTPAGEWQTPVALDDGNWDHYAPAVVARGGSALVVWSGQTGGNFELYVAEVGADGKASKPERLTSAPHADFNVRAAADGAGNVTVVWQSFRAGQADIYARRLSGRRWGPETRISSSDASDWEPAVALDSRGVAWISWDSYHAGNYDVYLRSFDGRRAGEPIAIATETSAQFHSTVAVDGEGRVWVAWDDAGENWGKDFSRASAAPGSQGLHFSRKLGVRVYS
ncbi:MAG: TolB family protein, partial [Bryobacteraceae bacterium]